MTIDKVMSQDVENALNNLSPVKERVWFDRADSLTFYREYPDFLTRMKAELDRSVAIMENDSVDTELMERGVMIHG